MNILDIAQNSISAGASLVEISLVRRDGMLELTIRDDGRGMDAETLRRVTDPFCTSRSTRRVGLGLPFLRMAAEMTGGGLEVRSAPGAGTTVRATFTLGHIDLMPLGDMGGTLSALVQANPDLDFVYTCVWESETGRRFTLDTREVRRILDGVPLSEPAVAVFIRDYVNEHEQALEDPEAGPSPAAPGGP